MKKSIFFLLLFLIFQKISLAADEGAISYSKHPWLETLSAQEQRAALVMYQIALSKKVNSVMVASKSDNDRIWGVKIMACGHLFAAQSATKNEDQRKALAAITMAFFDWVAGKGTHANRTTAMREAEMMGQKVADSISDKLANHVQEKYSAELKRLNTDFIAAAMICASEKSSVGKKP